MKHKSRSRKNLDWAWDQATVQDDSPSMNVSLTTISDRSTSRRRTKGGTVNTTRMHMTRSELIASRRGCMTMIAVSFLCPLLYLVPAYRFWDGQFSTRFLYAPDTTLSSKAEPSYKRLCRAILEGDGRTQIIYENMSTCLEKQDLSTALSQMFASAFLSNAADLNRLRVTYEHKCHLRLFDNDDGAKTTVQELFPLEISIVEPESVAVSLGNLNTLCEEVLERGDKQGAWVILDHALQHGSKTVLQAMLSTIQSTLHFAAEAWDQVGEGTGAWKIQETVSGYLVQAAKEFRGHGPLQKLGEQDGGRATIYLPCVDLQCTDMYILPNYAFLLNIPNSVRKLDLIVPSSCFAKVEGCGKYANSLAKFLIEAFPRTDVTLVRHLQDAYADTFNRMLFADYAICGPGFSAVCAFPTIARREGTYQRIFRAEVINETLAEFSNNRLVRLQLQGVEFESLSALRLLSSFGGNVSPSYVGQNLPNDGRCRFIRGRRGGWVKDHEYGKLGQYKTPLRHFFGLADIKQRELIASGSLPPTSFRDATSYRWHDGRGLVAKSGPSCDVRYATGESMCQLTGDLNVTQIVFVGDSTSLNQALSLYKLLEKDENVKFGEYFGFRERVPCGATENQIDLVYAPFDPQLLPGEESQPWLLNTRSFEGRSLIVFNIGSKISSLRIFKSQFSRLIGAIDSLDRQRNTGDIVLFRTSVQSHERCDEGGSRMPFLSYEEYAKGRDESSEARSWNLTEAQNDFVTHQLERRKRRQRQNGAKGSRIELLDVHPMTVLRQDGHVGRTGNGNRLDCVDYSLPGPVDFWNHLMYSNLADVATEEGRIRRQQNAATTTRPN